MHDEERMELKGRSRGKVFKIGDKIQVRLAQADPVQGWVDFEPVVEGEAGLPPAPARQAASGRKPSRPGRGAGEPEKARKSGARKGKHR
jgi:ribonuclease R